jgi:hypothetical protein
MHQHLPYNQSKKFHPFQFLAVLMDLQLKEARFQQPPKVILISMLTDLCSKKTSSRSCCQSLLCPSWETGNKKRFRFPFPNRNGGVYGQQ